MSELNKEQAEDILKTFMLAEHIKEINQDEFEDVKKSIDVILNRVHYLTCKRCGKEFRIKYGATKYCNDCTNTRKEYFKEWYAKQPDEYKKKRSMKYKKNT